MVRGAACALALAAVSANALADTPAAQQAEDSLRICAADDPSRDSVTRLAALDRGVALADAALTAAPRHPRAHLARFCNLGRQLALAGISWRSFQRLRALQATIDRAMALDPDDPDILVGKGTMLAQVPSVLGGDAPRGEVLLRRALALRPAHVAARLELARLLVGTERDDAAAAVEQAIAAAERHGTPVDRSSARALLDQLDQ